MATVFKRAFQAHNVFLVIRVRLLKFVQNLHFFKASAIPKKGASASRYLLISERDKHRLLTSDDLDSDFPPTVRGILKDTSSDDVGKHALPKRRENLVTATVQLLAEDDLVIALWI